MPTRAKRRLLALLAGAAIVAPLCVLLHLATSRQDVDRMRREVEALTGPRAALRERSPERLRASPGALRLEAAARPLGIDVRPDHRRQRDAVTRQLELEEYGPWLRATLADPRSLPSQPPQAALSFLATHRDDLAALRAALQAPDLAPQQSEDDTITQNDLHYLWLARMLLVDALVRQDRGDGATARADVMAATRIAEMLRGSRFVIHQLIGLTVSQETLATARRIDGIPPAWTERFDSERLRQAMLDSLAFDAHVLLDLAEAGDGADMLAVHFGDGAGKHDWLAHATPMLRSSLFEGVRRDLEAWRDLSDAAPCGTTRAVELPYGRGLLSLLELETGIQAGSLSLRRLDRYRVHVDLTRRVLALRAAREADPARQWPASAAGTAAGECPSVRWLTKITPGTARIEPTPDSGAWFDEPISRYASPPATRWSSAP